LPQRARVCGLAWSGAAAEFDRGQGSPGRDSDRLISITFMRVSKGVHHMASDSVYRIVDVVGVSEKSWEDAGRNAVETAAGSLRDLRVAEVTQMDMKVEDGKVTAFRTRVALSFKYEPSAQRGRAAGLNVHSAVAPDALHR